MLLSCSVVNMQILLAWPSRTVIQVLLWALLHWPPQFARHKTALEPSLLGLGTMPRSLAVILDFFWGFAVLDGEDPATPLNGRFCRFVLLVRFLMTTDAPASRRWLPNDRFWQEVRSGWVMADSSHPQVLIPVNNSSVILVQERFIHVLHLGLSCFTCNIQMSFTWVGNKSSMEWIPGALGQATRCCLFYLR